MNVQELMKIYKHRIDLELARFFQDRIKRARGVSPVAIEALEVLKEFNLRGGKRIRPMLTVFSYKGFGGRKDSEIVKAALAVEVMEAYLLIHDDIMDQDELRRGYLTLHRIYQNKARRLKAADSVHYGNSMAIIVGDIACALGSEAILAANFPTRRKLRAAEKFNRVIINTCFGQMLDINSVRDPRTSEKDIRMIHTLKTAIYTIEGPLHIGALLAGAGEKQLSRLSEFAIPLGKAFQMRDDMLGMFGSQQKIGKPVGSDIREGKKTLLILKALERGTPEQQRILRKSLGRRNLELKDVERVRKVVVETGSLDYSKNLMAKYLADSRRMLEKIQMTETGKKFLRTVVEYIGERDR